MLAVIVFGYELSTLGIFIGPSSLPHTRLEPTKEVNSILWGRAKWCSISGLTQMLLIRIIVYPTMSNLHLPPSYDFTNKTKHIVRFGCVWSKRIVIILQNIIEGSMSGCRGPAGQSWHPRARAARPGRPHG